MDKKAVEKFDNCLYGVSEKIRSILIFLEDSEKARIQEIRMRTGKPLAVTKYGETFFVSKFSLLSQGTENAYLVTSDDIFEAYKNLTQNSVYTHLREIKQGYIMMKFGCRAGITGAFSEEVGITHISSVNIRIAREIFGVADKLISLYKGGGVLICGSPGSGKTTLLRDFIRQLSGSGKRIAAVDSRGELSASYKGVCYNDLGANTDVLLGFKKEKGIEIALRTLYPNIVAFDEIGTVDEVIKITHCLYGGVDIITTAHLEGIDFINRRNVVKELFNTGAISTVVMLSSIAGQGYEVLGAEEVKSRCGQ